MVSVIACLECNRLCLYYRCERRGFNISMFPEKGEGQQCCGLRVFVAVIPLLTVGIRNVPLYQK